LLVLAGLTVAVATSFAAASRSRPARAVAEAFARQEPNGAQHDLVTATGDADHSGRSTRATASTRGRSATAAAFAAVGGGQRGVGRVKYVCGTQTAPCERRGSSRTPSMPVLTFA